MVTGLIMFHVLNRDKENVNTFHTLTPIAILYASAAIFLGPGSFLMHGTHTEWGGWADNLSMVMYIVIPWLYNFKVMAKWSISTCLLYTSPSPRDGTSSRMPSSA